MCYWQSIFLLCCWVARCKTLRKSRGLKWNARQATREAVRHLVGLGHRRIALHRRLSQDGRPRSTGWKAIARRWAQAGLPFDARLVGYGTFRQESGVEVMRQFLAVNGNRPTAVFAANDLMAIGAMQALQEAGLAVPA